MITLLLSLLSFDPAHAAGCKVSFSECKHDNERHYCTDSEGKTHEYSCNFQKKRMDYLGEEDSHPQD